MSDASAIPDAVQWHEGMLLLPQHFQQAHARTQALQAYGMDAVAPYGWGVRALAVDGAALMAGIFSVTALEAIMPDGLLVTYPSPGAPPLTLDLREHRPAEEGGRIAVHVVVAARPALRDGEMRRYRSVEGPQVLDENTGDNAAAIPRLVPLLGLQCTTGPLDVPPARVTGLPLAVFQAAGSVLDPVPFEPPCQRVTRATRLFAVAAGVAAGLREKADGWDQKLSQAAAAGEADAAAGIVATLRALMRGLPRLEALLASEVAHPFDLYLALCDVAGDLAVDGIRARLPVFPAYAHRAPLAAFINVGDFIAGALAQLRTPSRFVRFARPSPGRFELAAQTEPWAPELVIGARLRPGQDPAEMRGWMEGALIGAASRIDAIRMNRAQGASRQLIDAAPEFDLHALADLLLFRVVADRGFVVQGDAMLVTRPADDLPGEPAELRLYLPLPAPGAAAVG